MGEYASKGVGGTALGVGIGALALGVLNGNGNGLLGGLFGNNNANCQMFNAGVQATIAQKDATIARLESEKYTDNKDETLRASLLTNWLKPLADESAANKVTIATIQAEQKAEAEKNDLREKLMRAEIEKQGLMAAQGIQSLQSQINCTNGNLYSLKQVVDGITKVVVPKDVVCPEYMLAKNAWVAPTNP